MAKQCNNANVKEITRIAGMYKSGIMKTIVNVCQFRFAAGHTLEGRSRVVAIKLVKILILKNNG